MEICDVTKKRNTNLSSSESYPTMKLSLCICSLAALLATSVQAFVESKIFPSYKQESLVKKAMASENSVPSHHPFCDLPGDPSLMLTTNVDLGSKKLEIMKGESTYQNFTFNKSIVPLLTFFFSTKGISKSIAKHTGKPETYVAVSITDNASVIFGGTDEPAALAIMGSIGAIGMESNGAITSDVTDLLEEFGVKESRIYINFFDMPRANVGWSRRTFAG